MQQSGARFAVKGLSGLREEGTGSESKTLQLFSTKARKVEEALALLAWKRPAPVPPGA